MATSLGTATRGRKKEALRLTVATLAGTVTNPGGEFTPTGIAVQGENRPEEMLDYANPIPKGSVILEHSLTAEKTAANVRELVRLALIDAGLSDTVSLHREHFRFDPIAGEAGYKPTAAEKRKGIAEVSTPDAPEGDSWALVPKVASE